MKVEVSKHNQIILIAENDADFALLGMWAEGRCRMDSSRYIDGKISHIAIGFRTRSDELEKKAEVDKRINVQLEHIQSIVDQEIEYHRKRIGNEDLYQTGFVDGLRQIKMLLEKYEQITEEENDG